MSRFSFLALLPACAVAPQFPVDLAPPGPGALTLELTGDTLVVAGDAVQYTVRGAEIDVGETVELGWGGEEASGPCVRRRLGSPALCLDIDNPVRYIAPAIAVADPLNPGGAMAVFDLTVPRSNRSEVYLQALLLNRIDSATSNVLRVSFAPPAPSCPGGYALIDSESDYQLYKDCVALDGLEIASLSRSDVVFPNLVTLGSNLIVDDSSITNLSLPVLETAPDGVEIYSTPLVSIDLGNLESTAFIGLQDLPSLQTVDLASLQTLEDLQFVNAGDGTGTVVFDALQSAGNSIRLDNMGFVSASFPVFTTTFQIDIEGGSLVSVSFPSLNSAEEVNVRQMRFLETVSMPNAPFIGQIQLVNNSSLSTVELGSLQMATNGGVFANANDQLFHLSLPAFTTGNLVVTESNMQTLSAPNMSFGVLFLNDNIQLTTVDVSSLTTALSLQVLLNPQLVSLDFPSLTAVQGTAEFSQNGSWCPDPSIDFDAISGTWIPDPSCP